MKHLPIKYLRENAVGYISLDDIAVTLVNDHMHFFIRKDVTFSDMKRQDFPVKVIKKNSLRIVVDDQYFVSIVGKVLLQKDYPGWYVLHKVYDESRDVSESYTTSVKRYLTRFESLYQLMVSLQKESNTGEMLIEFDSDGLEDVIRLCEGIQGCEDEELYTTMTLKKIVSVIAYVQTLQAMIEASRLGNMTETNHIPEVVNLKNMLDRVVREMYYLQDVALMSRPERLWQLTQNQQKHIIRHYRKTESYEMLLALSNTKKHERFSRLYQTMG